MFKEVNSEQGKAAPWDDIEWNQTWKGSHSLLGDKIYK